MHYMYVHGSIERLRPSNCLESCDAHHLMDKLFYYQNRKRFGRQNVESRQRQGRDLVIGQEFLKYSLQTFYADDLSPFFPRLSGLFFLRK
jgi:hypothetical protein